MRGVYKLKGYTKKNTQKKWTFLDDSILPKTNFKKDPQLKLKGLLEGFIKFSFRVLLL